MRLIVVRGRLMQETCEPGAVGMVAVLEKCGIARGGANSCDTLFARIYHYDACAVAVAQAARGQVMRKTMTSVLREKSAATALILGGGDPTRQPSTDFVQPGSGGKAHLEAAIAKLPRTAQTINALIQLVPCHSSSVKPRNQRLPSQPTTSSTAIQPTS